MTKKYIGTKTITAWATEKDGVSGYTMKYADGYASWSPKSAFEEAYRAIEGEGQNLSFGDALHMLKLGKTVARAGWNGKGMCLYLQNGSHDFVGYPDVVPGDIAGVPSAHFDRGDSGTVTRMPSVCMLTAGGQIVVGWTPNQIDMLASDWKVVV